MKNSLLLFTACLLSLTAISQSYNGPESVEFDFLNNRWLVANSSNGQIIARDASGNLSVFKSGISPNPYGLEIVGNTLYACCSSTIKGYDLTSANEVFSLNLGATFLNGITHDQNGFLFATDFSAKKIFGINIATQSFSAIAQSLVQSPNGIIYDGANNRLVFVNWGNNAPVKQFSFTDSSVTNIITTTYNNCDGIAIDNSGNWYISNWENNSVVRYDNGFANPVEVVPSLDQPADIFYNLVNDTLAIPNSGNNTVVFVGMNPLIISDCSSLPLSIDPDSISFGDSDFTADSMIRIVISNESGYDFAYPIALFDFLDPFPAGMTLDALSQGGIVFASSWNNNTAAPIRCNFDVANSLPQNYLLRFTLRITNLSPSVVDTCYFTDTMSVNLNPQPLSVPGNSVNTTDAWIFPNPTSGAFTIECSDFFSGIIVSDLTGRLIDEMEFQPAKHFSHARNLAPGVYLVKAKLSAGQESVVTKLFIQ